MSLRVAMIGCGAAARRLHLPGFRDADADVVAFASRTRASAEAAAAEWGAGRVLADPSAALDPSLVEAVAICTPNALHAELAVAAARAGLHVLVEKPMALTLAEADAMIDVATEAGVVLMVSHNARFAPPVTAIASAVRAGRLGSVRTARAVLRNRGPDVWSPRSDSFTDPARSGGGAWIDLGVHLADAIRSVTGVEAVSVAAMADPAPPCERDAHAIAGLADGVLVALHAGWDAPVDEFSLTVAGSEAIAHVSTRTTPVLLRAGAEPEPLEAGPADDPWRAFVRAAEGREAPAVSGEDGRAALAIIVAGYRSIASGAVEKV